MYTIFTYQMCISSNKTNLKYNNFAFNCFFQYHQISDNYIQCIIKLRKIGHILNYFQVKFNAPHPLPVIEEVRRPDTKYLPTPLYKQKCSICQILLLFILIFPDFLKSFLQNCSCRIQDPFIFNTRLIQYAFAHIC